MSESLDRSDTVNRVYLVACFAHTIQLGIKEGLKQSKKLHDTIGRCRDLVKKITDSPKLLEAFQAVCSYLKVNFKVPDLDVETRWNSTWTMVDSVLSLRKPLMELLRRIRDRHDGYCTFSIEPRSPLACAIPEESWLAMTDFCKFLAPFKDATDLMSGSTYPTLGLAVPVFYVIQQHVTKSIQEAESAFNSPHHTTIFARAVQSKLNDYEVKIRRKEALMAAALDPRIKMCMQKVGVSKNELRTMVNHEFTVYYFLKYKKFEQRSTSIANKDNSHASNSYNSNKRGKLLDSLMGLLDSADGEDENNGHGDEEPFANELERWLSHAGMKIDQSSRDVCMWFKVNSHLFPRIGFMARDFLGITSTSVPSECAFSKSGTTISKRRARLGDDAVTAIQELQAFLNFK